MSESDSRQTLVRMLRPLDAISIETRLRAGVPDINYRDGWIECKWLKSWPKSADLKPVKFKHPFLTSQKLRARKRVATGGISLLSAQVGRHWFFWCGATIAPRFGAMTKPEMEETALFYSPNGLRRKEFMSWITSLPNS